MSGLEITLLVIGIIAFVAGIIIPARKENSAEQVVADAREEIKQALEGAIADAKIQIGDMTDETVSYAVEKTERAMERVTNEKIDAISEYGDTVLKDINKNHIEIMFLYDMLTDKHDSVMEAVKEADQTVAKVKKDNKTAAAKSTGIEVRDENEPVSVKETFEELKPEMITEIKEIQTVKNTKSSRNKKNVDKKARELLAEPEQFNIQFANHDATDSSNSNEKILELYRQGKSNMVIAKELGLGVGEVKLVIDLFKGMS